MLQPDGWLPPGSTGACSPLPVQAWMLARFCNVHARVSSAPHADAAVAHSRNDEAVLRPSCEMAPPFAVTRSRNSCVALFVLASSRGMAASRRYRLLSAPSVFAAAQLAA